MKRLGPFLLALLLGACVARNPHVEAPQPGAEKVGQVGPDGTQPVADRGIGGTGEPMSLATAIRASDRGIGGTGIVGVVTGFGSIFVDGIEVGYDGSAAVDIDGKVSSTAALRAGQLVAVQADGPATSPRARSISVRSAAVGRIEALELGSGTLTIAGQFVVVPAGTWGANRFGLGDWVTVSGLRRQDGTIVASRLDPASPGALLARGQIVRDGGVARVGSLLLSGAAAESVRDGQFVVVSGTYSAGHGNVSTVASDPLFPDPADYFGSSPDELIVQSFVRVERGSVIMNGVKISSEPAVSSQIHPDGIAVVSLRRKPDGSYTAVSLHYGDYRGRAERSGRGGQGDGAGTLLDAATRNRTVAAIPVAQPSVSGDGSAANGPLGTDVFTGAPYFANYPVSPLDAPATAVFTPVIIPRASAVSPAIPADPPDPPAAAAPDPPAAATPVPPTPVPTTPTAAGSDPSQPAGSLAPVAPKTLVTSQGQAVSPTINSLRAAAMSVSRSLRVTPPTPLPPLWARVPRGRK